MKPHHDEYARLRELIDANSEVLILGHKDADGDTLGCSLAFAEALERLGKTAWVLIPAPLPAVYEWLPGFDRILEAPPPGADPHLVLFFDAGTMERSGSAINHIAEHATVVNVDHHNSNSRFGDVNIIDTGAAAVGQMMIEMLDGFGYPITPTIATNLYTALMTDTGGFRHENTTARVLECAARLAALGANPGRIAEMVYKSAPLTTLKLSGLAMASMQVELDGRLAWARVSRRMLKEAGAVMAEAEGIIDQLNSLAGLELAVLFKEVGSRLTKISVRSRGEIDASRLCGDFGGGGHLRAAGAEVHLAMEDAVDAVLEAAREQIRSANGASPLAGRRSQRQ